MKIDPRFSTLPTEELSPKAPTAQKGETRFADFLTQAVETADRQHLAADAKADAAARGEASLHDVAIALEKADIETRLLMRGRNKIVDAYQEIMRMPV